MQGSEIREISHVDTGINKGGNHFFQTRKFRVLNERVIGVTDNETGGVTKLN